MLVGSWGHCSHYICRKEGLSDSVTVLLVNLTMCGITEKPSSWMHIEGIFLDWFIRIGIPFPKFGSFEVGGSSLTLSHTGWQPTKEQRKKDTFALCLLVLALASLALEPISLGHWILMSTEDPASWTEQTTGVLAFSLWDGHCWRSGAQPVSHSNKPPFYLWKSILLVLFL